MFKKSKEKPKIQVRSFRRRRLNIFLDKTKGVATPILRRVLPVFVLVITVILVVFVVSLVRSNKYLKVTNIELLADDQDKIKIEDYLSKYKEVSILNIQPDQLANDLKKNFSEIRQVYVEKKLNGELDIEVVREVPAYLLTNLTGTYILNYEGKVIKVLYPTGLSLNDLEQKVLTNTLPLDDDTIKNKYLEKITDPVQKTKVDWTTVPTDQKQKILNDFINQLNAKIETYYKQVEDKIKASQYTSSISFFEDNNSQYNLGDSIDHTNIVFMGGIIDYLKEKNLPIKRLAWISDYSLKVSLESGVNLIFSTERDIQDQLKDMDTVLFYGKLSGAKVIDVRSSNYSITH